MIPLYSTSQIRLVDELAVKAGYPSIILMENAAVNISRVILEKANSLNLPLTAGIICGKGNNGGDGFATARHLANSGFKVSILSLGSPAELSHDCKINYDILTADYPEAQITHYTSLKDLKVLNGSAIIIDAILGSGAKGNLKEPILSIIKEVNKIKAYKAAIDMPTGLDADTGFASDIFEADLTITLGGFKKGLFFASGYASAGEVFNEGIGVNSSVYDDFETSDYLIEPEDAFYLLPGKKKNANKYTNGKVFTIAGSGRLFGAPMMTSKAVFSIGAGASILAYPNKSRKLISGSIEEVIIEGYGQDEDHLTEEVLGSLESRIEWADVVAIGPGLGRDKNTIRAVNSILQNHPDTRFVIDADALFAISNKEFNNYNLTNCILTPHHGEFARLIGIDLNEIEKDILNYGKEFSRSTGSMLVLKGAPTIIFNASGEAFLNSAGNAGMAKFGTGDVLTGIVAGVYSQLKDAEKASICGVYLHSLAADLLKEDMTEFSYTATDIITYMPKAIKFLRNSFV